MTRNTVSCCIAGCQKTTKRTDSGEWICGRHWHRVPRETRYAIRRAHDLGKSKAATDRLWARCKRLAAADLFEKLNADLWRPE